MVGYGKHKSCSKFGIPTVDRGQARDDLSSMKGQLQTAEGAIEKLRAEIAVIFNNTRLS